ncbi:YdcH family protein [Pseudoalteromonas sp. T1lg65]|uniref:YdcH family protein n=1 Tax=Pseudoalteromonas sp. T1lg65 TaxID=2077101 RepID=UPI003F78B7A0
MNIERHTLSKELPEFKDKIHELKMSDRHFSKLFDEYHDVDNAVIRIEDGVEHSSDDYLESLKKQRLHLKDQLFAMLKQAK